VDAVAAVSPHLAKDFKARFGVPATYLPLPWATPEPCTDEARATARRRWGYRPEDRVLLYAGNLDAYQGWEDLAFATAQLDHRSFHLLMATESPPGRLWSLARTLGFADRLRLVPLRNELHRRRAHAACDLAIIPRRTPGGLPIKLLDALARGCPTVAMRRATAGLDLRRITWLADDDSPRALARAIQLALASSDERRARAARGRAFIIREHSDDAFLAAVRRATSGAPARGALRT
jgi:glycosyltransferase involved in cell wall biosynthesis